MAMANGHHQNTTDAGGKELKIVIVGDGGCGKTSLLMVFAKGDFPEQYAPSVFEKYVTDITIRNKKVTLTLYDTAGQEDYDRLRPLSYQDTNVILICYDVTNPTSFENVRIKWVPEVNHFCQEVPILLIGCKTDLRMDKERLRRLRAAQQEPITYNQGEETAHQIKAVMYLECSAKFRENIEDIFKEASIVALSALKKKKSKRKRKQKQCLLL
ncbi:rho-related GTP-binding protein RhoF isoform X1 [Hypanus sabinus]|uniref:rho-related GTP-binding protein RhoF isoform X1 n=1 Tax=Hypanus sabinus TaxID=79690 RepID=UPI0028C4BFE1|nr:rho-related GTP-binding protein RhoF isoform X1 [Hypanus sabinus]